MSYAVKMMFESLRDLRTEIDYAISLEKVSDFSAFEVARSICEDGGEIALKIEGTRSLAKDVIGGTEEK